MTGPQITYWVLGGVLGVFFIAIIMALMAIAKRADKRMEEEERMDHEWGQE